ncbi:MAG: hypothetical protein D6753_08920 [Planctomycetota bacterium]|nr:MAG: hypothetical protein D6753_08920 [Planctomycetota bacterium]
MPASTNSPNALILCLGGVGQWLVGACGAATARTGNLDALAAGGHLWMNCFVDALDRRQQWSGLWTGRHALQPPNDAAASQGSSLWQRLSAAGVSHCLITDDADVAGLAEQLGCREAIFVESPVAGDEPADDVAQCACMGVFLAAAELIQQRRHRAVYVHSRGLHSPWDAPMELRMAMTDPDDPPPPTGTLPPGEVVDYQPRWSGNLHGASGMDPDVIIGWNQVAAAQVQVLDRGVGLLRAAVEETGDPNWAWLIHSLGQIPLGEHGQLGSPLEWPYSEHLRALAILRPATALPCPRFHLGVCQLPSAGEWLLGQLGLPSPAGLAGQPAASSPVDGWLAAIHDTACGNEFIWARTPAWSLRSTPAGTELYAQPDDRWEVCNVADLQPQVVEAMQQAVSRFQQCLAGSVPQGDSPPEVLMNTMR